jgi:hypothetical protein
VTVRGDNVTMLTMVLHFKGCSQGLAAIAREAALEVADAAYRPLCAEHIPGVANGIADALSRMHEPGATRALPACLRNARRVDAPARPRTWYRALGPPPARLRQWGLEKVPTGINTHDSRALISQLVCTRPRSANLFAPASCTRCWQPKGLHTRPHSSCQIAAVVIQ